MRWVDRHGKPRPVDDVLDEHMRAVRARLAHTWRGVTMRRSAAAGPAVLIRGNCRGPYTGGGDVEAARVPDRNPLAW